ncbi:MAG: GC-type dockerin domain-anchored protein, partial [Bacteroidota bacterium]
VSFEMEEGLNYVYCISILDEDEDLTTIPATALTISFGDCQVGNCINSNACNYDPNGSAFDQNCVFPGCNDPLAINFDINAACSDGSCEYASIADFNSDGFVAGDDLLTFLSAYACPSYCPIDLNYDGQVDASDLLIFLSLFGES